jgi:hypothetical protein
LPWGEIRQQDVHQPLVVGFPQLRVVDQMADTAPFTTERLQDIGVGVPVYRLQL